MHRCTVCQAVRTCSGDYASNSKVMINGKKRYSAKGIITINTKMEQNIEFQYFRKIRRVLDASRKMNNLRREDIRAIRKAQEYCDLSYRKGKFENVTRHSNWLQSRKTKKIKALKTRRKYRPLGIWKNENFDNLDS